MYGSSKNAAEQFMEDAKEMGWKTSTQANYWATFLAAQQVMGQTATQQERQLQRHLRSVSQCQEDVVFPKPYTHEHLQATLRCTALPPHLRALLALTWLTGQRLPDMCQLRKRDLSVVNKFNIVTLRHGKVIKSIGPYSLPLPHGPSTAALVAHASSLPDDFSALFTETEKQQMYRHLHNLGLEVRSVRRGSLEHMSIQGTPMETILMFSKHQSTASLHRYLRAGATLTHSNTVMTNVMFNHMDAGNLKIL